MPLFADPLHDEFAAWATGYITTGGADYGEIVAIAEAFPDGGDDAAFYDAWAGAAARHAELADEAERAGRTASARGHLLRAAAFYGVAIHIVYGKPVDARMVSGFDRLTAAFERSLLLEPSGTERLTVPFDSHHLPTWFVPAEDSQPGERRPLVIVNNGYDATMADAYLGLGKTARERGYHVVLFDGPGQGELLVKEGVAMVPDWERVVSAVVDAVIDRDDVDGNRIALHGWSLGGHLAPRAATGEHRLAAVVADPALWGVLDGMHGLVAALGFPELAAELPDLPDDAAAKMAEIRQPEPRVEARQAGLLGQRCRRPAGLPEGGRALHPRRTGRRDPLPCAGHGCRRRPAGRGSGDLRRPAEVPHDPALVHLRTGRGRAL